MREGVLLSALGLCAALGFFYVHHTQAAPASPLTTGYWVIPGSQCGGRGQIRFTPDAFEIVVDGHIVSSELIEIAGTPDHPVVQFRDRTSMQPVLDLTYELSGDTLNLLDVTPTGPPPPTQQTGDRQRAALDDIRKRHPLTHC